MRTNIGSLLQSLPADRHFIFAEVRYRERGSLRINPGNLEQFRNVALRPYLMKGREFEHEREVRIVTKCRADQKWFFVPIADPRNLIKEVIVSPYLDTHSGRATKKLIEDLLDAKFGAGHGIPVNYSKINDVIYEEEDTEIAISELVEPSGPAADHQPL